METKRKDNLNNEELRSVGVQNLLDKYPHWLILKGNFLISVVLLFFLLIVGYSVKYPDFVNSKVIITPKNKAVIGQLTVSQADLKKIKSGQRVIIKLYDFPYQEFGVLEGQVQEITSVKDEKGDYIINITIPKSLKTSYNKNLAFNKELKGNAEIITQNLRLIEKFFY